MLEANNPQLATGQATVRASKFSFNTARFTCGSSVKKSCTFQDRPEAGLYILVSDMIWEREFIPST